ncbi:hypothetical protein [Nannocystis pusilla]|uniref:hypothetical protein n=1 Tax=Nannocystis pusilla TaxID=889268 RepID=UPI003B7DF3D6
MPSLADADTDAPAADPAADPAAPAAPVALVAAPIAPTEHTAQWRDVVTLAADTVPKGFQYFATGVLAGEALVSSPSTPPAPGPRPPSRPSRAGSAATGPTRPGPSRSVTPTIAPSSRGCDCIDCAARAGGSRRRSASINGSWPTTSAPCARAGTSASSPSTATTSCASPATAPPIPPCRWCADRSATSSRARPATSTSSRPTTSLYVQLACADEACVQTNSIPLPQGAWEWEHTIPRQKHSVSIALHDATNNVTNHVLHYETGGWKLEALPAGARLAGIWPTSDGGMWAQTETGLLHRDPAGAWRSVALPAGFQPSGPVFAAMTGNLGELVIVGARDGGQVVVATAAKAQAAG